MSKYIDSEKLIAEIERLLKLAQNKEENEGDFFFSGEIQGYKNIITIIDSLQQDPRFPLYDNIVEKVFGAGNLDGWERDEAEILVALAKEELLKSLQQEQTPTEREIAEAHRYAEMIRERDKARIQQEQLEVDLEKFTEKIKTFQGRYKYPEILSIKGAMAFMARMFYQYPNIARQWYDSLPKTTMD